MIDALSIAHGGDLSEPSGGTDRVSAITNALVSRGVDITLVAPEPTSQPVKQLNDVHIETVEVPTHGVTSQPMRAAAVSRQARDVARERGTQLQFEHSTLAGIGSLWGCEGFVLDMHDFAFESPLYGNLPFGSVFQRAIKQIENLGVRKANHVVVVSEKMKHAVVRQWNVPKSDITVVPNGFFKERIARFRTNETVAGRVTFLGTLHPKLDTHALVDIARLESVEELYVIGDGNEWETLNRASENIQALKLTGRLPDEEAFDLVSTSATVVNPQHNSTLQEMSSPVKLTYYAALGVPIVTTVGPNLASELAAAGAAVTVAAGGNFAAKVDDLLNDEKRRMEMSERALAVAESWTWDERLALMMDVYQESHT